MNEAPEGSAAATMPNGEATRDIGGVGRDVEEGQRRGGGARDVAAATGDRDDGVAVGNPLVAEAARRVIADWKSDLGDFEGAAELAREVTSVALAVADPSAPTPGASALRKRALDLLRSQLLRGAEDDSCTDATLVHLLRRCEAVREKWDADWSAHFASRLSEPDGLDLAVDIAHDLRSPLASILFLSEVLWREQSGAVNDTQRRQLGIVYSAALRLISMASDIIELARGGNLVEPEPEAFSVGELLRALGDMVRPMAEEKGLGVRVLPPDRDVRVGQPAAIRRVLLNLATNSLKFTEEGFVEVMARESGEERIEFSVRDTGPGIPADVQRRLFQPFRRVRGRRGYTFSGAGLGLAASRKLVEAMGGRLGVDSRPDRGTRFAFELRLPPATKGSGDGGASAKGDRM